MKRKKQANGRQRKKKPKLKELKQLVDSALSMVPALQATDGVGLEPLQTVVKQEPVEFQCCICFQHCYSRTEMLQHYKAHLSAAVAARGAPPAPPPPPPDDPVVCTRCHKSLPSLEWGGHWLSHWHRDARPLRCALCERAFRLPQQALRHGLDHQGESSSRPSEQPVARFGCDLCPQSFAFLRCVRAHRLAAHPDQAHRPLALRCALCERAFAHLNSLRRHLRAHSGERNFLCSMCGKALSSREHLKFHLRIHTGYKPNVCKTCGKGFVKKCNLTLHERVHSGEKPHVCSHCGKAFSQRSTLVIHERYHSGARPYSCALCGRGFVAKGLLSMHLKTTCI